MDMLAVINGTSSGTTGPPLLVAGAATSGGTTGATGPGATLANTSSTAHMGTHHTLAGAAAGIASGLNTVASTVVAPLAGAHSRLVSLHQHSLASMASTIGFGGASHRQKQDTPLSAVQSTNNLHGSTATLGLVSGMTSSVTHLAEPVATGAYTAAAARLYNPGGMMVTTSHTFDKLVSALGSASKHDSRSVIDALMLWRKAQNTAIDAETVRRNMSSLDSESSDEMY